MNSFPLDSFKDIIKKAAKNPQFEEGLTEQNSEMDSSDMSSNGESKYLTMDFVTRINDLKKSEDLKKYKEENLVRKYLSYIFVSFSAIWVTFMIVIVLIVGFKYRSFSLDSSLLIALITTSAASVFGLSVIVAKYFFKSE